MLNIIPEFVQGFFIILKNIIMLKSILKLEGAQEISVVEQKKIKGGALTFPSYCNWRVCADPNYLNDPLLRRCKDFCDSI